MTRFPYHSGCLFSDSFGVTIDGSVFTLGTPCMPASLYALFVSMSSSPNSRLS